MDGRENAQWEWGPSRKISISLKIMAKGIMGERQRGEMHAYTYVVHNICTYITYTYSLKHVIISN
jgi:hypothetical protein